MAGKDLRPMSLGATTHLVDVSRQLEDVLYLLLYNRGSEEPSGQQHDGREAQERLRLGRSSEQGRDPR